MIDDFVMTIKDIFSIPRGPVVTGTVEQGIVRTGQQIEITGGGITRRAVVKIVELFRKVLTEAHAGQNVGLLLEGVRREDLAVGQMMRTATASAAPRPAAGSVAPVADPRFGRAEAEYARLRQAFDDGTLTADAFEGALSKLTFEYGGRYWMIGANTGQWYASQGDQWVTATPPRP